MSVYNDKGEEVSIFSLWKDRKVVVAFTRHMGCRFCKEQALLLEKCRIDYLAGEEVTTIIVSIGCYTDIPKFREETGFTGEIYVDKDLLAPKCFQLLRFENGKHVLFDPIESENIRPQTIEAANRSSVCLPDGGYGDDVNPYKGDVFQIGGLLVVGPGNNCDFVFRSAYVGDIPDMQQVVASATGLLPLTNEETTYPQTLEWNRNLSIDSKLSIPLSEESTAEVAAGPSPEPALQSISVQSSIQWQWRYWGLIAVGAVLLFAPRDVEGPIFAAVTLVTAVMLIYYRPRNSKNNAIGKGTETGGCSGDDSIANDIELITLGQLDERTLLRRGSKCECGFVKNIDMTVLKAPAEDLTAEELAALEVPIEHQQPLEAIQCYVREFLAKPNPLLGRKGPTCPFVPGSIKMDSIYLGLVKKEQVDGVLKLETIVMAMLEEFKKMEPISGPKAQFKAIILIFPFISLEEAPKMIDGLQRKLKPLFVSEGLMLGEFHKLNNATGLHNDHFFPLRTPVPCLAIRNMVPSDIVFLNGPEFSVDIRRNMISRYLKKFGDSSGKNDEQTEVALKLLSSL